MRDKLVIEVDVDGVLLDLWGTFFTSDVIGLNYADRARAMNFKYTDIKTYTMKELPMNKRELAFEAFADEKFMSSLFVYKETQSALRQLYNLCLAGVVEKVIVNTLVVNANVGRARYIRLLNMFSDWNKKYYTIQTCVREKIYNVVDIRIEDNPLCFDTVNAKYNFLIDQPYNHVFTFNVPVIRCKDFADAVQKIQYM